MVWVLLGTAQAASKVGISYMTGVPQRVLPVGAAEEEVMVAMAGLVRNVVQGI